MKVISRANETVLAILRKPKSTDGKYRKMHFCVEKLLDDGVLLHHTLTKELLFLTQQEYEHFLELDYLRERWFVVPEDTKDKEYADLVKWVLTTRQKKGKEITAYTIFTTTDCNARCFYCFELGRSRMPMSQETALKVVQYIKKHCGGKKVSISWFGGEPLYNQEAIDTICTGLREEGIAFSSTMVTNAYLFDEDVIKRAVDLWNLKRVQITLDGTEAVYNRIKAFIYREGSAYQRVLGNMERLLDASISVVIRMNMDMHNAEDLLLLAQELAQRFGGKENINVYAHHLFKGDEAMAETHTEEEWALRDEAMCRIEECLKQSGLSSQKGLTKNMRLSHCMADNGNAVTILPNGNIGLCEHFSETEVIGHIDREGFDTAVVESWKATTPKIEACATCFYYPDCVMLKKCPSGNKCFLQYRERRLRQTVRQMENEYKKWQKQEDNAQSNVDEFC